MPKQGFNICGERHTGEFRLRPGLFGAVLEERVEDIDGSSYWQKTCKSFKLRPRTE